MSIPIQDPGRAHRELAGALERRLLETVRSGRYLAGSEVRGFEAEFAAYCGVDHAVAVANGTDALEIALRSVGCEPGDEVVMVANAGMYAAVAALAIGAVPVFVDVRDRDLLVDARRVADAVGDRTRAVVATHLYGRVADVDALRRALGDRSVALVEDCAQAHGARRRERRAGSLGDIAAFSFYPTKNLGALGDAGAVVTDSGDLAEAARALRQYGWGERFHALVPGGRNSRMDEVQAACLRVKLEALEAGNARRVAIADRYVEACASTGALRPAQPSSAHDVRHLFVVRAADRDAVRRHLEERGVDTAIHYPVPDHLQPALRDRTWRDTGLAVTERAADEILTVPCFPELTDDEVATVAAALASA